MSKYTKIGHVNTKSNGKFQLILADGITILKDGQPVEIHEVYKSLALFDAKEGAENLAKKGVIDKQMLEDKLAYIDNKNIRYDVVACPVKD